MQFQTKKNCLAGIATISIGGVQLGRKELTKDQKFRNNFLYKFTYCNFKQHFDKVNSYKWKN